MFLIPLLVALYLTGFQRVNSILRALFLAGATLYVELAVLSESRGAMVAMTLSLPTFFLVSGHRLWGLFARAPLSSECGAVI